MIRRSNSRAILFVLITTFQFWIINTAHAEDKFGQIVSEELERNVDRARQMRLPYLKETYDPITSVKILEQVVTQKSDYYRAYFNLGLSYHELDDYSKSKAAFDKALEIRTNQNIDDDTIINTAGWVSIRHSDFQRAEKLLIEAKQLTGGDRTYTEQAVISNLGELYFLTQRFDLAVKYFKISRDKFGSTSANFYLEAIKETQAKIKSIRK